MRSVYSVIHYCHRLNGHANVIGYNQHPLPMSQEFPLCYCCYLSRGELLLLYHKDVKTRSMLSQIEDWPLVYYTTLCLPYYCHCHACVWSKCQNMNDHKYVQRIFQWLQSSSFSSVLVIEVIEYYGRHHFSPVRMFGTSVISEEDDDDGRNFFPGLNSGLWRQLSPLV